ncbi:MAG: hypothetical protein U9R32_10840 [Bacteroidota bacterium]|nr:hypothetical protein [Bacteroidota bacterium]
MNKQIDKENIMLNKNLNALISEQTNYKRMKRAILKKFNTHDNDYNGDFHPTEI